MPNTRAFSPATLAVNENAEQYWETVTTLNVYSSLTGGCTQITTYPLVHQQQAFPIATLLT